MNAVELCAGPPGVPEQAGVFRENGTMSFLAALRENERLVFLSEGGVWLPRSAFNAPSEHRVRVFRYEESARGVAEDWARKAGCEAVVEAVR